MPNLLVSSAPHKIKLKDGSEVLCNGQPEYQAKTGYYRYRTPEKRDGFGDDHRRDGSAV